MAGRSKARKNHRKPAGPSSDSQAKKTKSMDDLLGVNILEVESETHNSAEDEMSSGSEEGEILSPKLSLVAMQNRSESHKTFSPWLSVMKSGYAQTPQVTPIPVLHSTCDHVADNVICIELDDIQEEVDYWNSALICAVLGANPPLSVIEGFFRRVWKDFGVDKVVLIEHGVYLVRFFIMENRDKILDINRPTFDKKPVICKPWHKDIVDFKDEVKVVPIWLQLKNLDLKFWGSKSLSKIVSAIGTLVQADQATIHREKLQFARVQVEVALSQDLPDTVRFQDENGDLKVVKVVYEWKPTVCAHCKLLGHLEADCRKKKARKKWVAKAKVTTEVMLVSTSPGVADDTVEGGFTLATNTAYVRREVQSPVVTTNSFQALDQVQHDGLVIAAGDDNGNNGVLGINRGTKQRDVKSFLNSNKCSLVFLLETKVKVHNLGALYLNLFDGWSFTSNNMCHPGGRIVLAWNPSEFQANPFFCSSQLIHGDIGLKNGNQFACSFIYAHNSQYERCALWNDLCSLAGKINGPWILMGDFNCVLNTDERIGSAVRLSELKDFQNCVNSCGLEDAKFTGNFYTWNNKQLGNNRVFSKLDRVLVNQHWCNQYPHTEVCFKNEGYFDHCPGVVSCYSHIAVGKKYFKFFQMWQEAPNNKDLVSNAWNISCHGTKMYQIVQKLKSVKSALKLMNKERYGDIEVLDCKTAHNLQQLQNALHLDPSNEELANQEKVANQEYMAAHSAYLSFLGQKAKAAWIKEGDANTTMFHRSIKQRQIHNSIFSIKDMHGRWTTNPSQVPEVFLEYYKWLLGTSGGNRINVKQSVVNRGHVVSDTMQAMLNSPYTKEEVKKAMWEIDGTKAPGPDGFGSSFFKGSWGDMGMM
ncbi:uncharacterized protein [Spinacia oleracea]|uniref:DUF4283 domain-containing protein n=1 Tax=Spinacia oleracea TaxID=3562 RepID=A0ABM3R873_SPIOL|nr:uncharacterized protein LOC130467338 [Spinacia oleracea]